MGCPLAQLQSLELCLTNDVNCHEGPGIVSNAVSDVPISFSSSTLKSSSSDTDGSLVASKVTSSDTDGPSSLSLPLLSLGADITLNKPTCLFAIVKSGYCMLGSKCSSCRLSELHHVYCNLAGSVHWKCL